MPDKEELKQVEEPRNIVLTVEVPAMDKATVQYVEGLRDELGLSPGESESSFILNCLGEPGICKLTTEVSGEKEGDIITVWGSIRSASIQPASRGYGSGHLTEEELEENASCALNPDWEDESDA